MNKQENIVIPHYGITIVPSILWQIHLWPPDLYSGILTEVIILVQLGLAFAEAFNILFYILLLQVNIKHNEFFW